MSASLPDPNQSYRIAVIGAGAAGLSAAWLLQQRHQVDIYEKNDYLGGHTCTVEIPSGPDEGTSVDMGFIVMNHRNYPVLTRLLQRLDVALDDSDMSFSFRCLRTGYAYAGSSMRTVFAQPSNLVRPGHWKMLFDIVRFNKHSVADLESGRLRRLALGDYLDQERYGKAFTEHYLFAMGSAIWSAPTASIRDFPAESFVSFFRNHGLLTLKDRPQWRYVKGGSQTYIRKMRQDFKGAVTIASDLYGIRRTKTGVLLESPSIGSRNYDYVVIGAHANEALGLLQDPTEAESRLLGVWSYQLNEAVLHSDISAMPAARSAWASWNFIRGYQSSPDRPVSVTYDMNRLQQLRTSLPYFVSLNHPEVLDESSVIERRMFTHPMYSFEALASQPELPTLNGVNRTYFCGSYFGYGFHEDAIRSGVEVARAFGIEL